MDILQYFKEYYIGLAFGWNLVLSNLILTAAIVVTLNDRPWKSFGLLHKAIDFLITWVVEVILFSLYYALFGLNYIEFVIWPMLTLIHMFFSNRFSWNDRIIRSLTLCSGIVLTLRMSSNLGDIIFSELPIFTFLLTILLIAFFVFALLYFPMKRFAEIPLGLTILQALLFLVTNSSILICDNFFPHDSDSSQLALFFLMLCFYVFSFVEYLSFYFILKERQVSYDRLSLLINTENDLENAKMTQKNLSDLRKMRHDMKNQYQFMKLLLEKKDYEKLNSFFSDIMEDSFVPLSYVDCGNSIISGIMNMEIGKAAELHIPVDRTLLVPEKMHFSDTDLFSLFTNIIDNSLEAMQRYQLQNSILDIKIIYQEPYLTFEISNPVPADCDDEELLSETTLKDNKEIHGYGKRIIQDIVKKYSGSMKNSVCDHRFVCKGMLYDCEVNRHD